VIGKRSKQFLQKPQVRSGFACLLIIGCGAICSPRLTAQQEPAKKSAAAAQVSIQQVVRVRRIGGLGSATGNFQYPNGIAVDPKGNVYVADSGNHRIVKLNSAGETIGVIGASGPSVAARSAAGAVNSPMAVAADAAGNVYVADTGNDRIQKFSPEGKFLWQAGNPESKGGDRVGAPHGIAVDKAGNVYAADTVGHGIVKFNADGKFVTRWGDFGSGPGQLEFPHNIAVDQAGNVYVADFVNHRIEKFTAEGKLITAWGRFGAGNGQFHHPWGVAVDAQQRVWVADMSNSRIQAFTDNGKFLFAQGAFSEKAAVSGQYNHPKGLAIGPNGELWLAHPGLHSVDVLRPQTVKSPQ
jgi:tripartite motif-containing protein 71